MKRIIVRACAIIAACIALFAPGVFALNIDLGATESNDIPGNHIIDLSCDSGFVQIPENSDFGTGTHGPDGLVLDTVADGLFAGSEDECCGRSYYIDPSTMCAAVSDAGMMTTGGTGMPIDEHLCRNEGGFSPLPVPGTMFVLGVSLLGLSILNKRTPETVHSVKEAVHSEGNSFFPVPAPLHASEARAAAMMAPVVPIKILTERRVITREAGKYRVAMERLSPRFRKEMVG